MSGGPGAVDWGGPEIDLRAAGDVETSASQLQQSGLSAGDSTLNALSVVAPDNMEILALEYHMNVTQVLAAQEPVPTEIQREPGGQLALATQEDDFGTTAGFGRDLEAGDYFQGFAECHPSFAWEDPTNGVSGGGGGQMGTYYTIHDPGKDSETGPLVIREGDTINVHLELLGAIGADDVLHTSHRLTVWWDEIEEFEETDVRERFPSRSDVTI